MRSSAIESYLRGSCHPRYLICWIPYVGGLRTVLKHEILRNAGSRSTRTRPLKHHLHSRTSCNSLLISALHGGVEQASRGPSGLNGCPARKLQQCWPPTDMTCSRLALQALRARQLWGLRPQTIAFLQITERCTVGAESQSRATLHHHASGGLVCLTGQQLYIR
jgi:hypothetical protein